MASRCYCYRLVNADDGTEPSWPEPWAIYMRDHRLTYRTCDICAIIHNAVTRLFGPAYFHYFNQFIFPERNECDAGPLRVSLTSTFSSRSLGIRQIPRIQIQIYTNLGCQTPWKVIGPANHVSQYGLSESCIKLAKSWLKSCTGCEGRHSQCAPEISSTLPTRVIDLGTSASDSPRLKICSLEETCRYIALSHCWGGLTPISTTTKNIATFMKAIPSPLPQTFQDAISVTRALGVRYLWIDSLCIIQDSPDDWAYEAPHMGTVYGGAYVTLAADAASNSSEGFLNHCNRTFYKETAVDYSGKTEDAPMWVRERGFLGYQLPFHDFNERLPILQEESFTIPKLDAETRKTAQKVHRSPGAPTSRLSTRGWVFQERALSPRTIHFGRAEMAWECASLIDCECCANSVRYRRRTSLLKQAITTMSWTKVLEEYTSLDLTVAEDRMAALSGLAEVRSRHEGGRNTLGLLTRIIRQRHPDRDIYVAGLFKKDMKEQLLWHTFFKGPALEFYIAPTWSWASIRGPIKYSCPAEEIGKWNIKSASGPPRSKNPFGDVKRGSHIVIQGLLATAIVEGHTGRDSETSLRLLPGGHIVESPEQIPRVTIIWDSEDRKNSVLSSGKLVRLAFFTASAKDIRLRGILMRECDLGETAGAAHSGAGRTRSFRKLRKFERVAFVEGHQTYQSRRANWSDDSSDEEAPEYSVIEAGMGWMFWNKHSSWCDFVLY